jgi:hypothetical protein
MDKQTLVFASDLGQVVTLGEILRREEEQLIELKQEASASGDWDHVLWLESSFTRLPRLVRIWPLVAPEQRHQLLAEWWVMCDGNLWRYRDLVVLMFRQVGYIGDPLPQQDPVRLYRGINRYRWARGVSWTADMKVARFFADGRRVGESCNGYVYMADVPREAILGRFTERNEDEYVVDPALLPRLKRVEVVHPGEGRRTNPVLSRVLSHVLSAGEGNAEGTA